MSSMSPISSIRSTSPASSLPIIDSQSAYDQEWENDIDNDYNENNDDNNNNSVENNENDEVETEVIIVHPPAKGIAAWLSHLHRNQTRNSILQTLRSLVF